MSNSKRHTAVRKIPHCQIVVFRDGKQIDAFNGPVYYQPWAEKAWKLQVRYQKMYRPVKNIDTGIYRLDMPSLIVVK